jgi:hypothetical protein
MEGPLIALLYSHRADYQPLLEWQLKQAGLEQLHVPIVDFSWRRRQLVTLQVASEHPNRLLIFPDAWDTVLLGSKNELETLDLSGKVTVAGAKVCWPDNRQADYAKKFGAKLVGDAWIAEKWSPPWKFVNSNPLAGLGRDIAKAIGWGLVHHPLVGDSSDVRVPSGEVCERFWTNIYLDGPAHLNVQIDFMCRLNQTYLCNESEDLQIIDGRIYNTVTGTYPVFLHLNGKHLLPEGLISL